MKEIHAMLITDKHVFFYTNWLSNFYKTKFEWTAFSETHEFFCTEQAFMWAKAMYFYDRDTAQKILEVKDNPMACKKLGRLVKGYNDVRWAAVRESFMYEVNCCKYSQDNVLKAKILDPRFEGKTFVEASPIDTIWGIGRGLDYPDIDDESTWSGTNLLGKVLTDVREVVKFDVENGN